MNIPVDSRYRFTLRLWSLDDTPQFIAALDATSILSQRRVLNVSKIPGTSMSFASIDLTSLLTPVIGNSTNLTVTASPSPMATPSIWGMLSITNNDTQQVTIISPH
jgi:hypothetical protein